MNTLPTFARREGRVRKRAAPMSMSDFLRSVAERGDAEAFRKLFEAYAPRVKSYMMRRGASNNMAEELAQETLLTVWRKASLYSVDKGSPTTWIFTIARNLRIDRLRKEETWIELPDDYKNEPSTDATPDDALAEEERRVQVQRALAELPEDQREAVVLSYIDGLSQSEIAERLGLPLGTVKSRMRLAYAKIRDAVEDLK